MNRIRHCHHFRRIAAILGGLAASVLVVRTFVPKWIMCITQHG